MRFRILGSLQVRSGAGWVLVPAAQQRVVLAVLLAEAGTTVSTDRLVDAVWADRPPRRAVNTVQAYVMRLRRLLGDEGRHLLVTRGCGYEVVLGRDDLDAAVFERLVSSGREAVDTGRTDAGATRLAQALELWRGEAFSDVPAVAVLAGRVAHLEQVRLTAQEDHLAALLDLGRHETAVDQLYRLVEDSPLRERQWALLMRALTGCGRRAEALEVFQRARQVLRNELGLEPGPALRELQHAILTDDPATDSVTVARPVVASALLPADVVRFTGRADHLVRLDGLLRVDRGDPATAVVISAIAGTAGVGKTALAVRWAHLVRHRFPDGQLYVNLHGYGAAAALRPIDVLAMFLPALGVRPKDVPDEEGQAVALYRSLLADKRMLVVLDNANSAEQVRPLLPGGAGCLALVTSRDQLRGLVARDGAVLVELDVLTPDEATALLAGLLDDRAEVDHGSVAELARLCGYLPLALRIAAANLIAQPTRPIADYVAELAGDQLAALEVDGDPETGVRSAFDHSYSALPATTRRMFRRLGVFPGADLTAEAAAALTDMPPVDAARELDRLVTAHLVEQHRRGRYAVHDLIRRYAGDRAAAQDSHADRHAAQARLYEFYLCRVDAAARRLYPHMVRLPTPSAAMAFDDDQQALAWLETEQPNLVAAVRHAAENGPPDAVWRLGDALHGYFYLRMRTPAWQVVAELAVAAAAAAGDQTAQAAGQLSLASLHWVQGRYRHNVDDNTAALALARAAGWAGGESVALGNLGTTSLVLGQLHKAVDYYTKAVAIDRRTGWLPGLAAKLGNLGQAYGALGRLELATEQFDQAVALHRQSGSRSGEGRVCSYLGKTYHLLGRFDDARATLTRALAIHRAVGDRSTEADSLRTLAAVHAAGGHHDDALELADAALALTREIGDRRVEAEALTTAANIHLHLGNHRHALDGHTRALALARDIGHRNAETVAHLGLAAAQHTDHPDRAAESANNALTLARRSGYRNHEGKALTLLAAIHLHDNPGRAVEHAERAAAIHTETGHRLGKARAHLVASSAYHAAGDERAARLHQDQAHALFTEIGTPAAQHARAILGQPADK